MNSQRESSKRAAFLLLMSGLFDGISVVMRTTILQLATPDSMRGRVSAINGIFIGSSNELGAFESGLAARLLGLVPSVVFGGVMTIPPRGVAGHYLRVMTELVMSGTALAALDYSFYHCAAPFLFLDLLAEAEQFYQGFCKRATS